MENEQPPIDEVQGQTKIIDYLKHCCQHILSKLELSMTNDQTALVCYMTYEITWIMANICYNTEPVMKELFFEANE